MSCLMVVSLAGFSGCIFSPKKKDPIVKPPPSYPILGAPDVVLTALAMAYQARDSNEVKVLYDSTYVGTSTDQVDRTSLTFYKAQEIEHVAALARRTSIIGVDLAFPPSLLRFTSFGDPPGWATIQITQGMKVEINDSPQSYFLFSTGVTTEFKFVPKTPDPTSQTDTTWKIIRWTENH